MTIRIVVDSTCDLPAAVAQAYGIVVVPCYINIGTTSFLDGVDLTRQEFYARLQAYATFPKTATPGIEMFKQTYERLIAEGTTEILSIHLASTLSALFNVAKIAAGEITRARVTVFDSRQLSLGAGWLALTAAQLAAQGKPVGEIVAGLREQVTRTHAAAVIDSLEFLRRGGRISWLLAGVGTALQIKPVFRVYDGQVILEKTRTRKGALERLLQLAASWGALERAAIVYTDCPERAEELRARVRQNFPQQEIEMSLQVTPILGAHLGPGTVGIVCVTKPRAA